MKDTTEDSASEPVTPAGYSKISEAASDVVAAVYRPSMPDWGAFLRWPEDGTRWLHEEDVPIATQLLPSNRVFCRRKWDGSHYWLHYGEVRIRTRPAMWTPVQPVDLEVGQQVELLSRLGKHDSGIFRIAEVFLDAATSEIEFQLSRDGLVLQSLFSRDDLRPVYVKHHLRVGFYKHQPPKSDNSCAVETLDVGDLLDS